MKQGTVAAFIGGVLMLSVAAPTLASALADDDPSETASPSTTSLSLVPHPTQSNDADHEATDDASDDASEATLDADANKPDKPKKTKVKKPDKGPGQGPPPQADGGVTPVGPGLQGKDGGCACAFASPGSSLAASGLTGFLAVVGLALCGRGPRRRRLKSAATRTASVGR